MDKSSTINVYILGAIIVVLVVILIVQYNHKRRFNSDNKKTIAVKTTQGVIKIDKEFLIDELNKLYAELDKHRGFERSGKYTTLYTMQITTLKEFIKRNPKNGLNDNLHNTVDRSIVVDNALAEYTKIDSNVHTTVYKTILDDAHDNADIVDNQDKADKFEVMLMLINIVIQMLRNDVCDNGVIDYNSMHEILQRLDQDLTQYSVNNPVKFNQEIGSQYPIKATQRIAYTDSETTQVYGEAIETGIRNNNYLQQIDPIKDIKNMRTMQQGSQLYDVTKSHSTKLSSTKSPSTKSANHITTGLGGKQYVDDLLIY